MEILALGEKIKRRRKELDMTLKDLAGDRITPGQISLVESGKSNPSMDLLEYLAETLQTSVEYLIESEESQAEKISLYFEKLAETYILLKDYSIAQQYIDISLKYVEKYKLQYRKAKILYLQHKISVIKCEFDEAKELLLLANEIFTKNNNYEDIVNTFLSLGKITLKLNLSNSSRSYLRQAEKVYIDNNMANNSILGEIYYYMAKCYFKIDDNKKSIKYANFANEKLNQIHNRQEYGRTLLSISEEYRKKDDLINATKYAQKTLEVYKDLESTSNISEIENKLGRLFYNLGNINESLKHYEIAEEIRVREKDDKTINTLMDICKNYIKIKEINRCEEVLKRIKKHLHNENVEERIEVNILWYRVYLLKEMYLEAENILINSYRVAKENNITTKAGKLAMMLGKFYIDSKRDLEAEKYLDEGVNILREYRVLNN